MKNFDRVIADLRWLLDNHDTATFAPVEEIENAIRLLEAAGKVDKAKAIDLFDEIMGAEGDARGWRAVYTAESARPFYDTRREIRAILAALPDPVQDSPKKEG